MSVAAVRVRRPRAPPFVDPPGYVRHRPESTLLYQLVEQHYPAFRELRAEAGRPLPDYVQEEFDAYLKCGRLEEGFLRVRCEHCHAEKLVAFSCKKRGFCPSCGARRMAETAALLADEVLPERPLRQWVLSLPYALRFLLAIDPAALTLVLGSVYRVLSGFLLAKAALTRASGNDAKFGSVIPLQRLHRSSCDPAPDGQSLLLGADRRRAWGILDEVTSFAWLAAGYRDAWRPARDGRTPAARLHRGRVQPLR